MKASSKLSFIWIALAFAAALVPSAAKADTYDIFVLDSDEGRFFRGMDAQGTVILAYDVATESTCLSPDTGCFRTYAYGAPTTFADTLPIITPDNGTPCTPSLPTGAIVYHGVCNNGYEAFLGKLSITQYQPFLYVGPDNLVLGRGTGQFVYINSEGDIVWNDPNREFWYEAIDTTTHVPEPTSLTLLATGALAALGAARRRLS